MKTKLNKEKIVNTAEKLFIKKGYECVSVNEIIREARIAKGTFYHYFRNKEDVLDALIDKVTAQINEKLELIIERTDLDSLEKLTECFGAILAYKKVHRKLMKVLFQAIFKKQNIVMFYKIQQKSYQFFVPVLAKIIKQGKKEGIFRVSNFREVAEVISCLLVYYLGSAMFLMIDKKDLNSIYRNISKKTKVFEQITWTLLGVEAKRDLINKKDQLILLKNVLKFN